MTTDRARDIRVLIADDEALVRAGFMVLVDAAPGLSVVGQASDGVQAVRQARALKPDVVLMDIRMPVMDGLEATKLILDGDQEPPPRILVVTTFDEDEHVFEALRSGASGFVLKDTQPEKLLDAITIVAAGEALLAPAITRRLIAEFARRPRAAAPSAGDVLAPLTEREREVLQQVAAGSSNAEVAAALHLSVATVKTHISRLLSKLDCRDRAQLVVVAYETGVAVPGLRLSPPRPGRKIDWDQAGREPTIGRMPSYQPVDLSAACNAGVDVLGDEPGAVPLGRVDLRGLPFQIGPEPPAGERCFLLPRAPTSVAIGRLAPRVIVAHRLLEPGGPAGHAVGQPVAEYVFHLAGGDAVSAPIRERFEIQVVPPGWGRLPFLAVTDSHDYKLPRFEGRWDESGVRLAEHGMGEPAGYFLWCWENPLPERPVERIEVIPRGPRFIVAAITTSDVDEHPFVAAPSRPVRLVAKDGPGGVLDVDVDRGVATYPQPLPGDDDRPGWGANEGAAAYASIAALPSATVAVRRGDDELGRVRWGDVERDGRAEAGRVSLELTESGRNWVHVSVVDDATGRPVPCRVHFRSPEGIPYQPHGHHDHVTQNLGSWHYDVGGDVRLGQRSYAYIDGTCQGWLPRGDVVVDVARGFEYEPLRQTVRIEPGQRELTLRIERVADLASEGWWSGDSHVHFLSTPGAQLEQRGEDLRVVNLLQAQWGALFTNTEDFSGRPGVVDGGGYVTYVGQENRQHVLGHSLLWGLREPVMPWSSDGPDEAELGGALDATLSDWADRAHAQGGTVVAAHFPNPNGEPAVLVATGRADAVEMLAQSGDAMAEYYRYLNCGYRLPLVGGTDKMSSAVPVGLYRTYARLDEEFSYEAWCRAVRSGRTFLSGGPLLALSVDGREPGDTVALSGPGTVSVHAAVRGIFPLRSLEIVRNGEVVARAEAGGERQAEINQELRVDGNSWIACRAFGVDYHLDEWGRRVFAHTSPVYVACGGDWTMADPEGLAYMRTLVEGAREYVRHTAVRRPDRLTTHHHGEADHLAWLERPFAEALRALDDRGRVAPD